MRFLQNEFFSLFLLTEFLEIRLSFMEIWQALLEIWRTKGKRKRKNSFGYALKTREIHYLFIYSFIISQEEMANFIIFPKNFSIWMPSQAEMANNVELNKYNTKTNKWSHSHSIENKLNSLRDEIRNWIIRTFHYYYSSEWILKSLSFTKKLFYWIRTGSNQLFWKLLTNNHRITRKEFQKVQQNIPNKREFQFLLPSLHLFFAFMHQAFMRWCTGQILIFNFRFQPSRIFNAIFTMMSCR